MLIRTFISHSEDEMNYGIAIPTNISSYENLPLLIYLHGAGERGRNFEHIYRLTIPKMLKEGKEYPAVILFPQCPAQYIWNNIVKDLKQLIDRVVKEYGIQKDRIMLTGSSMGGYGTWEMAMCYPELFAAIAPVAGGGILWRTTKLKNVPVLAYHGEKDPDVPLSQSQATVDKTNANGGTATLHILNGFGHNDGIEHAYRETDLIDKLLTYRKSNFEHVPEPFEEVF